MSRFRDGFCILMMHNIIFATLFTILVFMETKQWPLWFTEPRISVQPSHGSNAS